MKVFSHCGIVLAGVLSACSLTAWANTTHVIESERNIPLAQSVDVVVVGGSCGAVAAAQAAARAGASVFLAAPRNYLGDDIAGALRLWLNEGDKPVSPLARALFIQTNSACAFTYQLSAPSGGKHEDDGQMLGDGRFATATSHSVEFADDVTITLALETIKTLDSITLMAFQRKRDFEIGSAAVSISTDGQSWSEPLPLSITADEPGSESISFARPLAGPARFVKVEVRKKPGAKRILLGEIIVRQVMPGEGWTIVPTPLHVKQLLDKTLLEAGVSFLTGSYITGILRDGGNQPAGIVIVNRSGRQAIAAKVIIDATERGTAARLAGARFQPFPSGEQQFKRIIIAGDPPAEEHLSLRQLPGDYDSEITIGNRKMNGRRVAGKAFECTLPIFMPDGSFQSFAAAEQTARDRTFVPSLLEGADTLFLVPPDPMTGSAAWHGAWPGSRQIDLECFKPRGIPRIYLLGGCADLPRPAAEQLLQPLTLMEVGERIGSAAATEARDLPQPQGLRCAAAAEHQPGPQGALAPAQTGASGAPAGVAAKLREFLNGVRPFQSPQRVVASPATALPVLGTYDVVVVGGGTCGAPAGIAAGRQGARTLVIEQLYGMGGISTLGMIGVYCYGNICGFTSEYDDGVKKLGAEVNIVGKQEWWRRENRLSGTELWFGTLGCGVLTEGSRVTGVIVATPAGRGVVIAGNVVDATGNSDLAAAAGAECMFQGAEEIAVQGVGLSLRQLGASYINSDFSYVNDSDAADLWLFGVRGRARAANSWDVSQLVQSRERQRIVGEAFITPLDILNKRTFPDTVVQARSNFDSHGYTIADICFVCGPGTPRIHMANIPYRAMLPQGIDNIIVAGLGISAHRDAMPIIRMQPDIQNMGYVAGFAAATASKQRRTPRAINIREVQQHLVEKGIIPAAVLEWRDSWPVNPEKLALAVKKTGNDYDEVHIVLDHPDDALPLLRQAYAAAATPPQRLCYAHVLGMLGDPAGVETLVDAVRNTPEGTGVALHWSERMGRRMSDLDTYMIALGRTRDPRALPPLLEQAGKMTAASHFMRFRAITLALEPLRAPAAAQALARLLQLEGIRGHAMTSVSEIATRDIDSERNRALREIALARVLYRCGDEQGLGEATLKQYALDLRGIYALHATAVLKAGNQ